MSESESCNAGGGKCRLCRMVLAIVIAGLLTCMATSLWQIEHHLRTIAEKCATGG